MNVYGRVLTEEERERVRYPFSKIPNEEVELAFALLEDELDKDNAFMENITNKYLEAINTLQIFMVLSVVEALFLLFFLVKGS